MLAYAPLSTEEARGPRRLLRHRRRPRVALQHLRARVGPLRHSVTVDGKEPELRRFEKITGVIPILEGEEGHGEWIVDT